MTPDPVDRAIANAAADALLAASAAGERTLAARQVVKEWYGWPDASRRSASLTA